MTPALAVVLLLLAALVAFVVWVLRASSRHARERAIADRDDASRALDLTRRRLGI
jgi:hypothetical protein